MTLPPGPAASRPAGAEIPDVPDAVLGWRTWWVGVRAHRRAELIAPLAAVAWTSRRAMVASCGSRRHTPPGDRCACGLYAVDDPSTLQWSPSDHEVLGVVALWGDVVEGTRGWRASHGYPRLVVCGPAIPGEQRAAVSRRYGIPVHASAVPARTLAAFLAAEPTAAEAVRRGPGPEVESLLAARMPEWRRRWEAQRERAQTPPVGRGPGRSLLAAVARRR